MEPMAIRWWYGSASLTYRDHMALGKARLHCLSLSPTFCLEFSLVGLGDILSLPALSQTK